MGTIEENYNKWSKFNWKGTCKDGDRWSTEWGGTSYLWHGTILPRIKSFLPTGHILEIAPGFGRCTQFLIPVCDRLSVVDLTDLCIESCKERFRKFSHINYFVNDGKSLDMLEDGSLDFVFSWDSLVHAESDVVESYVRQLASKLKPGGHGFLHHSNIGAFVDPETGALMVENPHWRGASMTAGLFREYCKDAGLDCTAQELINWGGTVLNDCFSTFCKPDGNGLGSTVVTENPRFMEEAATLNRISEAYETQEKQGNKGLVRKVKDYLLG